MESYPKLIVGEGPTTRHLEKVRQEAWDLYVCHTMAEVRSAVGELFHSRVALQETTIWLPNPRKEQFTPLLKLMEESQLKLVICIPHDCVPAAVVSRSARFEKDDEVRFKNPIEKIRISNRLRTKVYDLFDI